MKTRNRLYDKSRLRLLCLLTALLGIFGAGQTWAQTKPTGAGTKGDPYQISTADELRWFAGLVNGTLTGGTDKNNAACAVLTTNIDLGAADWTPIGSESNQYTGTFDGAGLTISNLRVDNSSADYQGFVGYLGSGGAIQNLTLDKGCSVAGVSYVGGVCGSNTGLITNCTYTGVVIGGSYVGGVCGSNTDLITNCTNTWAVSGDSYVGGVCGFSISGTITNCGNGGAVTSSSGYVGGVCGYNYKNSTIKNCYNTGTVSSSYDYVGGICGLNRSTIESCYNTGSVSGNSVVGGVCGINYKNSTITKCYWLNTAYTGNGIGTDENGTSENVVAKTAEQFASGEVCWLLNGSASENVSWYQNLNNSQTVDEYPVPDSSHGTVYHATYCQGEEVYSNSPVSSGHQYDADGVCTLCGGYQPAELNGDVYEISNAGQLFWFAALVNGTLTDGTAQNAAASAVLTTDIVLTGEAWTPIGSKSNPYTGTFDGQNHTISGMTLENAESYSGLFGNVTGTVRDFTVTGTITITGDKTVAKVGGAVGSLGTASAGGTVSGVISGVDITVSAGNDHIGGVVGSMPENSSPTVENCVYTGDITVTVEAGSVAGVVGYIRTGTIQNCANQGGINTGGNGSVGGILGYCNNGKIYIRNCYNSGSIAAEGTANVGAIVGQNKSTQATVSNCCYLTGSADKGQGQLDTDAAGTVVKSEDDFKSGAVAYLLQGSQTALTWGQALDTDDYPVLTTNEAKRVYAAKLYKGSADKVSELYANTPNFSSPEEANALLVIEDAATAPAGKNIVVKSDDAYTCANLVLTDGADFYTPVAFTATQATYSRPLADGTQWGTVALPFDATSVTGAELFRVASQDGDALYVDETNGMAGGEPLVFRANAEVTEVGFNGTNVTVRATDAATGSTLLKGTSQTVSQLDAGAYFIYGDKFYRVASGSQIGVKPFRAYIPPAAGASTRSAGAASQLRIVFNASESTRTAHEGN